METFKGNTGRTDNTSPDGKEIGLIYRFDIDEHAKPHKTMHVYDIARYGGSGGPKEIFRIYKFINDKMICFATDLMVSIPRLSKIRRQLLCAH